MAPEPTPPEATPEATEQEVAPAEESAEEVPKPEPLTPEMEAEFQAAAKVRKTLRRPGVRVCVRIGSHQGQRLRDRNGQIQRAPPTAASRPGDERLFSLPVGWIHMVRRHLRRLLLTMTTATPCCAPRRARWTCLVAVDKSRRLQGRVKWTTWKSRGRTWRSALPGGTG